MIKLSHMLALFAALSASLLVVALLLPKPSVETAEPVQALVLTGGEQRIIVIGDLHGDYQALQAILSFTRVDNDTLVVQVGDLLDRGDDTIPLLDFFRRNHSFPVLNLLGNHEALNLAGNLRYVSEGDFRSFGGRDQRKEAFEAGQPYGDFLRELSRR